MSTAEGRIADAARRCYERCLKAQIPATCIAAFVLRLVDEQGWSREDAENAGRQAIQLLKFPPDVNLR